MIQHDLVVIGGGPAGLAAALEANKHGIKDILVIERDEVLGGILNQCIHNGFGLHTFKEELTGPEYAQRYIDLVSKTDIKILLNTMVIDLTDSKLITLVNQEGLQQIQAKAVILAMGCRERSRGAISLPGVRTAGIYTAGAAQKYCNIDGLLVGKRVVILGSGDIGLIMARRMSLEGAKVLADVELCPYSNGLSRNIVQCLEDFDIPLYLSHTVTNIISDEDNKRIKQVVISKVDEKNKVIPNTEIVFDCDTLLLSVGLIPENELSSKASIELDQRTKGPLVYDNLETDQEGIFACGNVLQVHDLVDNVSLEASKAGEMAAIYLTKGQIKAPLIKVVNDQSLGYTCPQFIYKDDINKKVKISFRIRKPSKNCTLLVTDGDKIIYQAKKATMIPSEMESVNLDMVKLIDSNEILVKVVQE